MLLISKFNDYYDSCIGYGVDKSVVYKRETEEGRLDNPSVISSTLRSFYQIEYSYSSDRLKRDWRGFSVLSFCGKPYVFYTKECYSTTHTDTTNKNRCLYTLEELIEYFNKNDNNSYSHMVSYNYAVRNFKILQQDRTDYLPLHFKYNSPILLFGHEANKIDSIYRDGSDMIINPRLKDIGFQKKVDPYTAFQEISMFISGVLGSTEKETVNISDKDLRDAKGFDKMSFKKYPTKRK
jgi:hypothetical protein